MLITAINDNNPVIYVGETTLDEINIDKIEIISCTKAKAPRNFKFKDDRHEYVYSDADCQLSMSFDIGKILVENEEWNVQYVADPVAVMTDLYNSTYLNTNMSSKKSSTINVLPKVAESHSWMILNDTGEVERYSGFNSFFGLKSKRGNSEDNKRINQMMLKFQSSIDKTTLRAVKTQLKHYFNDPSDSPAKRKKLEVLRNNVVNIAKATQNKKFINYVINTVFRSAEEMYIPIPNSYNFHVNYPNFFIKEGIRFDTDKKKLLGGMNKNSFNLIFEPSGDLMKCYITQDRGKAIQSCEQQKKLGHWMLRNIFQLNPYEPLTASKLQDIGINAIRLYKYENSEDIHFEFIYINSKKTPKDFIKNKSNRHSH